jgi:hypothetical protein
LAGSLGQANAGGFGTFAAGGDVDDDPLPAAEARDPGTLEGGDVHEHILLPVVTGDEAEAFIGIEPFDDGADRRAGLRRGGG